METVNLKRLAKELNLSISTVSRALRGSHQISKETADRVRALAAELGFQPNPHASSLRQHQSHTIAVVLPEIENNFFTQVMNGVEEVAREKGYHVLIYLTHESFIREKETLQMLHSGRVDGVMISLSNTTRSTEHIQKCMGNGLPVVYFDRIADDPEIPSVTTNNYDAAYQATEHLLSRGCRHIAFLSMSDSLSITQNRKSGYSAAMQAAGLPEWSYAFDEGHVDETNRQFITGLLTGRDRPDAVFAAVEKLAINCYQVCRRQGISIPEQLKIIGFTNQPVSRFFDPPLSSITQPAFAIGREAATMLFKIIRKKKLMPYEMSVRLPSVIIERHSSEMV